MTQNKLTHNLLQWVTQELGKIVGKKVYTEVHSLIVNKKMALINIEKNGSSNWIHVIFFIKLHTNEESQIHLKLKECGILLSREPSQNIQ